MIVFKTHCQLWFSVTLICACMTVALSPAFLLLYAAPLLLIDPSFWSQMFRRMSSIFEQTAPSSAQDSSTIVMEKWSTADEAIIIMSVL
jgi:hypothetical protein